MSERRWSATAVHLSRLRPQVWRCACIPPRSRWNIEVRRIHLAAAWTEHAVYNNKLQNPGTMSEVAGSSPLAGHSIGRPGADTAPSAAGVAGGCLVRGSSSRCRDPICEHSMEFCHHDSSLTDCRAHPLD